MDPSHGLSCSGAQIAAATAAIESKTERAGQTAVEIVNLKAQLQQAEADSEEA